MHLQGSAANLFIQFEDQHVTLMYNQEKCGSMYFYHILNILSDILREESYFLFDTGCLYEVLTSSRSIEERETSDMSHTTSFPLVHALLVHVYTPNQW